MGCANTKVTTVQVLPEPEDDGNIFENLPEGAKEGCCACSKCLKKCLGCLIF